MLSVITSNFTRVPPFEDFFGWVISPQRIGGWKTETERDFVHAGKKKKQNESTGGECGFCFPRLDYL